MSETPAIRLDDVSQRFVARGAASGTFFAVDHVSLVLESDPPRNLSVVGQSGSGKSTLARMILGLQKPTSGRVLFGLQDVYRMSRRQLDEYRKHVQPVFQDPYAVFNPFYRVDRMMWTAVRRFGLARSHDKGLALIETSLAAVHLDPATVLGRYPHQLSGGQRQRMMLARIHMLRPSFIIADEPVSMLDAQIRVSFLDILREFRQEHGISTLFVTHDLSTVHYLGGDVMVITNGRIVESGPVSKVLVTPDHPYTRTLLRSVPRPDPEQRWTDRVSVDDYEFELTLAADGRVETEGGRESA